MTDFDNIVAKVISMLLVFVVQLVTYIGPFVLGLVIIIFIWPFLCCCCVCPNSCPSKCCQKPDNEPYTKCELMWPSIVLIIALLLTLGASVSGITKVTQIQTGA